jgi:hypothetical protein
MKCAVQVLCKSAPVYTSNSTYQYILVRTCMYYILYLLVLSCNIPSCTCLGILVLPGTILYCLVPMGKSYTCLYSLVPNLGYLVLAGTVLYRLVLIGEILYLLVPSCTKLRNLVLPCTNLYRLVPIGEILYLLVLVQTGQYQYRPVRSNLLVLRGIPPSRQAWGHQYAVERVALADRIIICQVRLVSGIHPLSPCSTDIK